MSEIYRPEDSNNLATYPGPSVVKLDAAVNGELGKMIVSVAGYGQVPAAANKDTGTMRGVITEGADNSAGAQGALKVTARPGVYRFKNSGANPCTQAHVGSIVYASDGETISNAAADGPPAGTLLEFDSADSMGRPCKVGLKCFK